MKNLTKLDKVVLLLILLDYIRQVSEKRFTSQYIAFIIFSVFQITLGNAVVGKMLLKGTLKGSNAYFFTDINHF